tara:strand:- start:14868 stop:15383 length:516 start_codon:yes stop_codon:yes gene_type:complete
MKPTIITTAFTVLLACVPVPPQPANVLIDVDQIETRRDGRCFANDTAPAVIETVRVQELESAEVRDTSGAVSRPATFRTVIRQQIVRERAPIRFETVCPQNYTLDFVATLQRALKVRGFYTGPINGDLDVRTATAIRVFQRETGPDSVLLAIQTARQLGIVALDRDTLDKG